VGAALGWGTLAASSLVIGALLALVRPWPDQVVGLILGFGAGALISAVSFELAQEGARVGGAGWLALGLATGALTYYTLDGVVGRMGSGDSGAGTSLALGAFLDGVPEQAVLGIGLAAGDGVSVGLLAAIFVSNLPEAIGSASAMSASGSSDRDIVRLWSAVAAICVLATIGGFALADAVSGDFKAGINGFAAGALIVMLVDSMIPDATKKSGRKTGLVTTLGFAVAAALSAVS
jgi:zinc transporter, ZIP family